MITINIAGDFYSPNISNLYFGQQLKEQLSSADINVVNMEAPIRVENTKPIKKSGPNLCQDPAVPSFLEENGFNVIALANNHIMDYGQDAAKNTIDSFSKAVCVGAGTFDEAYKIKALNIKGKRIGFLSITQYEFGVHSECSNNIAAAWMYHPIVDEKIIKAKEECDYLIVLPHAGLEYFMLPLPELRTLYHHFIDMGADAVIAGHPHVPQTWETYKDKPIAYSIGNFCFEEKNKSGFWYYGLLIQLNISDIEISINRHILHYDSTDNVVEFVNNESVEMELERYASIFYDDNRYIEEVNHRCLALRSQYNMLMEMSGYYMMSVRKALGFIKRSLFGKEPSYNKAHFVNCMRCETHRWVLSRIYELENKS